MVFSLAALAGGAPPTVQMWSVAALKQLDAQMTAGARNQGLAVKTIGVIGVDPSAISSAVNQFPANALLLVDRISTGESEIHATQSDVMTIIEGSATLITGGKLTEERKISDTEMRGKSLTGSERRPVKAGDVIMIPATLPHQLVLKPGERLIYTVFKAEMK
jgi:mannose-6-phosphate isomerase-like protein (cupin superfamily)